MKLSAPLRGLLQGEIPPTWAGLARRLRPGEPGSVGPIGIRLGAEALHLVQFEGRPEGPALRAAVSRPWPGKGGAPLDQPALLRSEVRAALRSRPFSGRRSVAALDAPDVKLMVLDYSSPDDESEPQAILRLVGERVDQRPEELVIDYLPIRALGETPGQRSALVAVARRDATIAQLERLRLAGLEIDALEIAPSATRRLAEALGATGRDENALVLYAGPSRGHLIVLWGRRLVLYREIDFGEEAAVERLAKALDLAPREAAALLSRHGVLPPAPGDAVEDGGDFEIAETSGEILKPSFYQLAEHVKRALAYTASKARGSAPERAYLLGSFARWPRADRLLEGLVSMPVRSLDLREALTLAKDAATPADLEASSEVALAAGLALRGVQADG